MISGRSEAPAHTTGRHEMEEIQQRRSAEWHAGSDPPILMHDMNDQDDVWIDPKYEKAFLYRLDRRLLGFAMLGNMVKALDNSNLGNGGTQNVSQRIMLELITIYRQRVH